MALASALPSEATAHFEAAQLFEQAQDHAGALAQYREVLRPDPSDPVALAGAGQAAFRLGDYVTAQRYLESAVKANPEDAPSRELLVTSELILRANPFHSHISDAERNRRLAAAFTQSEIRLRQCAEQSAVDLNSSTSALSTLQSRWLAVKPDLDRLRSAAETALPDTVMDVVFQIEQQTAALCGTPQGLDLALLLVSQKRETAGQ